MPVSEPALPPTASPRPTALSLRLAARDLPRLHDAPTAPVLPHDLVSLLVACARHPEHFYTDLAAVNARLQPPATTVAQRIRRTFGLHSGPALLGSVAAQLGPQTTLRLLPWLPALEPTARGGNCTQPVSLATHTAAEAPAPSAAPPLAIRQGRLGDCWLIAALIACENAAPGLATGLIRDYPDTAAPAPQSASSLQPTQLCTVELYVPTTSVHPLLLPSQPVHRRRVVISTLIPAAHRCGDEGLRANAASLVEKAVAASCGGSYGAMQFNFAGNALRILTGRHCPATPVPRTLDSIRRALAQARPVVASTLVRPRGSLCIDREDGRGQLAIMDGHVYAAVDVAHRDEDGRPDRTQPLRVHLRNPLGGPEGPARMTDLYLSARQLRRCFISVNIGPSLAHRAE